MIPIALFANFISTVFGKIFFNRFPCICTVRIHYFICFLQKIDTTLTVMHSCIRYSIIGYQLAFCITFYMIFVSEMRLIILLRPACICIFLSHFRRIFRLFPFFRSLAVFDLFIFVPAISLAWNIHKGCINDRAFMGNQSF